MTRRRARLRLLRHLPARLHYPDKNAPRLAIDRNVAVDWPTESAQLPALA